jgi:hypothetical protein
MDNETIAKDLVAAYLTKNKLPTPKDVAPIAKRLADFYKATKDKLNPENEAPIQNFNPRGHRENKNLPRLILKR